VELVGKEINWSYDLAQLNIKEFIARNWTEDKNNQKSLYSTMNTITMNLTQSICSSSHSNLRETIEVLRKFTEEIKLAKKIEFLK
jgi:hypothetical protein